MTTDETPDFAELTRAVKEAQDRWEEAKQEAAFASSRETDCLNRLNQAQKALSKALADFQAKAPYQSDWAREAKDRERRKAG